MRANDSDAILITTDKDFGELVFRQKRVHNGVILVRLYGQSSQIKVETIVATLDEYADQLFDSFAVVSPGIVRIRHRQVG
jgi:predicted nuclease of predicted toxin-antitoxin system